MEEQENISKVAGNTSHNRTWNEYGESDIHQFAESIMDNGGIDLLIGYTSSFMVVYMQSLTCPDQQAFEAEFMRTKWHDCSIRNRLQTYATVVLDRLILLN